jgi:hypothetical protein
MAKKPQTYITFELFKELPKTKVFHILTRLDEKIGTIKWDGPFRKYCFFPDPETVWDAGCLNKVTAFLTKLMDERKT